ncbi:MAG: DUF4178 domain-containing protein [Planctomycetota bacterium]
MKWVVVLVLLVVLGVVLYMLFKPKKKPQAPVEHLADLGPMDARKGDTVSILAMGDEFDDLDFTVDRVNRYEAGGDEWKEVSGNYRGTRVFMEAWDDDGVQVVVCKESDEVSFSTLGLGEPDLIRLDESKDTSVTIEHDGVTYRFVDSGETVYYEGGSREAEGYYEWAFAEVDGDRELYIEKWEDEPFEASLGRRVRPGDCRVFRG